MRKYLSTFKEASLLTMLDVIKKLMKNQIQVMISDNEIEKMTLQIDSYVLYEMEKDHIKELIHDCLLFKIESYEKMRKSFEDISDLE